MVSVCFCAKLQRSKMAGRSAALLLLLIGTAGAFVIAPAPGVLRRGRVSSSWPRLPQSGPTSKRARRVVCGAAMGLEVFGSQGSRSPLVNWYLHELGVPFEMAALEKNPHPFGQIPSLKDGSVEVFESGAILLYLAQRYGGLDSAEAMAEVAKWVVWANSSLDPILFVENQRGQVIGTRLIENPKGIQVRRAGQPLPGPQCLQSGARIVYRQPLTFGSVSSNAAVGSGEAARRRQGIYLRRRFLRGRCCCRRVPPLHPAGVCVCVCVCVCARARVHLCLCLCLCLCDGVSVHKCALPCVPACQIIIS